MKISKSCIVLSQGPVPTPEHTKVEGGGLRCWGLAKGIKANNASIDITVAYHASYKKQTETGEFEGVKIATWEKSSLGQLIQGYDTVIVSYAMGELSELVIKALRPDQQLVLDCYVPIYVEVSARESKNIEDEYHAFNSDVQRWARVLKRGDLFLCASKQQKDYYQGVLSAVGRINPITYSEDLIKVVPYGIYRQEPKAKSQPIDKLIGKDAKRHKKILWFGGIYPWFDLRELVKATAIVNEEIPAKLIIVGAKNPYNTHPDFVARYDELVSYIDEEQRFKDVVVMQDWINFNDRADWYLNSDCVVVMNKLGPENRLAWRTRLVDFIWADLPIITNGGDPLGEHLLENEAAREFRGDTAAAMASDMIEMLKQEDGLKDLKKNIKKVKKEFYWDTVTKELSRYIEHHNRAKDLTNIGIGEFTMGSHGFGRNKLVRLAKKVKKVPHYAKKHGYKNTYYASKGVLERKIQKVTKKTPNGTSRLVFISHQLDMSGAPFVLMDIATEVKQAHKDVETAFITYMPIDSKNIVALNKAGLKPKVMLSKDTVPAFNKGDVVVLNTVAHSEPVKEAIFSGLENDTLRSLIWYVHEDEPELLFRPDERVRIKKLIGQKKLRFFIAAKKMLKNYQHFFETETGIDFVTYRHTVNKKYHQTRSAQDFSKKLSFSLPGTMGDGRKGQLPIYYAFFQFFEQYYQKNPDKYRDFELVYIGISTDFLSKQVKNHAKVLGGRFIMHGKVSHDKCMQIVSKSNITICYSLRECLPLFVFEGMITGHPILRNDSSGIDEQLQEGINGFKLETKDYEQVVSQIETILNKSKTSDKDLERMSKASYKIAVSQEKNSYLPALKDELQYFNEQSK